MSTIIKGRLLRDDAFLYDGKSSTATRRDQTGGTITGLRWGVEVDVLQVYGAGVNRTRGTLAQAVAAIGTTRRVTLVMDPGTWVIDDDLTLPENFSLFIPAGAEFSVASGKTLTILGNVIRYDADWTAGAGDVVTSGHESELTGHTQDTANSAVRSVQEKLQDIWCLDDFEGADADAQLDRAIAEVPDGAFIALRPGQTYSFAEDHLIPTTKNLTLGGQGGRPTVHYTGTGIFLTLAGAATPQPAGPKVTLCNLQIYGQSPNYGTAICISDTGQTVIRNVQCVNWLKGFWIYNNNYWTENTLFDHCFTRGCQYGWYHSTNSNASQHNTQWRHCVGSTLSTVQDAFILYVGTGVGIYDAAIDLVCFLQAEGATGCYFDGNMRGLCGRLGFENQGNILDYTQIHIGPNAQNKSIDVWCYSNTVASHAAQALVDESGLGFSGGFRFAQLNANALVPPGILHRYLGAEATDGTAIWNLRSSINDVPVLTINEVMAIEDSSQTPSTGTRGALYAIHAETRVRLTTTVDTVYNDSGGQRWLNVQNITFIHWDIDDDVTIHGLMYGTDPNSPGEPADGHRLIILKVNADAYELIVDGSNTENIKSAYGDWTPIQNEVGEYIYDSYSQKWFKMGYRPFP